MHPVAVAVLFGWLREAAPIIALCALIIAVGALLVLLLPGPSTGPQLHAVVDGREQALLDLSADSAPRLTIPTRPAEWQQGPPCKRGEHALQGACYQRYAKEDMSPPCEPGIYEHAGECWRAIRKPERKPSSVQ